MRTLVLCRFAVPAALALGPLSLLGQAPGNVPPAAGASAPVSFAADVAPLLAAKCVQCHAPASKMGDLDLTTREGLLKGGKHGPALVPGSAGDSRLYRHLTGEFTPQMPFGARLGEQDVNTFKLWINQGAAWDAKVSVLNPSAARKFTAEQKSYWFFQPVANPAVPRRNGRTVSNPVDAFILARLDEKGIRPNPRADKITLLRRATIDLTGLPPTPEETQAFLADSSPDAYSRVVDRLLASPHYGERWAREWLDVARYADTNGFKADEIRPNIWRYRDYVVNAFNDDKPYDRFIREQIAGDELYPNDVSAHIATGFLRHYTDETNQPSMELRRQELLQNITDTVGSSLMGLTYGCAKCHDHKFDAILQKDYYRLQAFFANIRAKDDFVALSGPELDAYNRQQAEWESRTRDLRAQMHVLVAPLGQADADEYMNRFSEGTRDAIRTPAEKRTPMQALLAFQGMPQITKADAELGKRLKGDARKQFDSLAAQLKAFDSLKPNPPLAQTMIDNGVDAPRSYVLAAGSWNAPKEEIRPGFLSILDPADATFAGLPALQSTGRRSALANWLADPKNPLTPRVMVNRIWQGHFGTGIVESSSDFGVMGERPTNPLLLDYLASAFVSNGWSIKKMHRLIMLSDVYQQSSGAASESAAAADPENKLLWHYPRRRVEGEVLRDSMLLTSGMLNTKMGGPGVRPELPAGVNAVGFAGWTVDKDEAETRRRSVYVLEKRILPFPMFEAFDAPTSEESCPRRAASVVPAQALTVMNDKAVLEWSAAFAARVLNDGGLTPDQRIDRAYRLAFSRSPNADERRTVSEFLARQAAVVTARLAQKEPVLLPKNLAAGIDPAAASAFVDFCHSLMSSNEFLYIN